MQNKFNGTLEYGAAVSLVEMSIRNIKGIGVDVTNYECKLKQINNEVNEKLDMCRNSSDEEVSGNILKAYAYGVEKLNLFMEELSKYKAYYQTMNKCMYLYNAQNLSVLSDRELSDAVESLMECLNIIKISNTLTEDINVIKSLYEIVFNIIKLEYKTYGSSKLVNYCKKDKIDCVYLSKNILKEIEEVSGANYDTEDIERIILKLNSKEGYDVYLDNELLMALSIVKEKEEYLKDLCNAIKKLNDKLSANNEKIVSLLENKEEVYSKRSMYKSSIRKTRIKNIKSVATPFFSLLLSAGILFGAGTGLVRLAKGNVFMTDTEIYSTETGEEKNKSYERKIYGAGEDIVRYVTIKAYDPWAKNESDGTYKRTVRSLTISDIDLDSAKEYLDLNLEELGYEYNTGEQEKSQLTLDDLYDHSIYEVTKFEQNQKDRKAGSIDGDRWMVIAFLGLLSVMGYACLIAGICEQGGYFGIILSIKHIIEEIEYFDKTGYDKEKLSEVYEKIEEINIEIQKLISDIESTSTEYHDILRKPESKKLLEKYQKGIDLLEEYRNEIKKSNAIILKIRERQKI